MNGLTTKWAALFAAHLLAKAAAMILAPLVCWLAATPDRRHLRAPWRWMETMDHDMAGDPPWQKRRIAPGSDPLSWWNRVRWIWRNGAQSLSYRKFGVPSEGLELRLAPGSIDEPDRPPYGVKLTLAERDGRVVAYYRNRCVPLPRFGRYLQIQTGWKLNYEVRGFHKIIFSIRLRSSKES